MLQLGGSDWLGLDKEVQRSYSTMQKRGVGITDAENIGNYEKWL